MDKIDQELEDKIARMELKLKGMYKQMYGMPVNTKLREDAHKVIRMYEKDLEQFKKQRG